MKNQNQNCEDCFKIKCKNCGWEPDEKELIEVQSGKLTKCPDCGSEKQLLLCYINRMAEPKITPPSQNVTIAPSIDVPTVASGSKEQENTADVSDYLKASESMPDISNELKGYIQTAETSVPDKDIIRASGENVPVSTTSSNIVQLPEVPKRKKAEDDVKNFGPTTGEGWKGTEFIREEDRSAEMEVLRAKLKELREKEKAA